MGQLPSYDEIPDDDVIQPGYYRLSCDSLEKTWTEEASKLMYKATFSFTSDNSGMVGRKHWENFVLGTDDDPDPMKHDPTLWGVKEIMRMFYAMGIPNPTDPQDHMEDVVDRVVDVKILTRTPTKGRYAGRTSSSVREWHAPNTMVLGPLDSRTPTRGDSRPARPRVAVNDLAEEDF